MSFAISRSYSLDGLTEEPIVRDQNRYRGNYHDHLLDSAFQPIVSPAHKRIVGYEALLRCTHSNASVNPKSLFELASSMNESAEIDHLTRSLNLLNFQKPSHPFWLFLNIHSHTINHKHWCNVKITEALNQVNIKPEQIVLEILEDSIHESEGLNDFVKEQKERGFLIAIDDFGAGESNFNRIWELQPDIVKLDKSLLTKAETNSDARKLMPDIVTLLKRAGCFVLFEGVETDAQLKLALESEVDMLQGYYFAEPSPTSSGNPFNAEPLEKAKRRNHMHQVTKKRAHEAKARRLQFEVEQVAGNLEKGHSMPAAGSALLALPTVRRCFLLDEQGIQLGKSICGKLTPLSRRFHPLVEADGASWAHRRYFQHAIATDEVFVSEEYSALPDAERTITASKRVTIDGETMVLCVDLSPEYLRVNQ